MRRAKSRINKFRKQATGLPTGLQGFSMPLSCVAAGAGGQLAMHVPLSSLFQTGGQPVHNGLNMPVALNVPVPMQMPMPLMSAAAAAAGPQHHLAQPPPYGQAGGTGLLLQPGQAFGSLGSLVDHQGAGAALGAYMHQNASRCSSNSNLNFLDGEHVLGRERRPSANGALPTMGLPLNDSLPLRNLSEMAAALVRPRHSLSPSLAQQQQQQHQHQQQQQLMQQCASLEEARNRTISVAELACGLGVGGGCASAGGAMLGNGCGGGGGGLIRSWSANPMLPTAAGQSDLQAPQQTASGTASWSAQQPPGYPGAGYEFNSAGSQYASNQDINSDVKLTPSGTL